MKLDVFANNLLGGSGQSGNLLDSPRFDKLNNALGGFKNANPMLITTMWQTLLESPDLSNKLYPEAVSNISGYPFLNHIEKFLLCLGNNKYCLLVFDPSITSDEPIHIDASKNNTENSINSGYGIWHSKMKNSIENMKAFGFSEGGSSSISAFEDFRESTDLNADFFEEQVLDAFEPQVLQYGIENSEWPMIICKPPKRVFTCYFPTTPHKVYLKDGEAFKSLAGVYTKNCHGIFGVTICLHCFPNSYVEAGTTKVKINGIAGTVISVHNISDSCFVQLDATEAQISDLLNAKGPLQGTTPREFEKCYFINKEGTKTDTNVIGWSPDIMYFDPYNQVKVLTNPITNPGDSGSALIDSGGNVLGFSFYRTEINAVKEFSAWIWAASVFKAHNLNFI
jgi:hypothetical protein